MPRGEYAPQMPRERRWDDDQLAAAVAASRSLGEVSLRLGLRAGGGTYRSLRRHIERLGIDAEHLPVVVDGRVRPARSWTDDQLRDAVRDSRSYAEVVRRLGYQPSGGMHRHIKAHMERLGLNADHFAGRGWAKGRRAGTGFRPQPLAEILVANSTYLSSGSLRRRLINANLKPARCEICGLDTWRGQPLPLALDHINGDPRDNRLENLRIVCPNCHALTETWCGRNRSRRTPTGREVRLRT
jgi:hypothetical protein